MLFSHHLQTGVCDRFGGGKKESNLERKRKRIEGIKTMPTFTKEQKNMTTVTFEIKTHGPKRHLALQHPYAYQHLSQVEQHAGILDYLDNINTHARNPREITPPGAYARVEELIESNRHVERWGGDGYVFNTEICIAGVLVDWEEAFDAANDYENR